MVMDRYSYKRMMVDENCKTTFDFQEWGYSPVPGWEEIKLYHNRYYEYPEPFMYWFSPDGKYFWRDLEPANDARPQRPFFYSYQQRFAYPDMPQINIFEADLASHHANRLEYFRYAKRRGKVIAEGYMDMLGQCYF
jgi:hypothetical protein